MACKRSAVRSRLPPPLSFTGTSACSNKAKQSGQVLSPSSRGLGHHPFTVSTGVRIPVGTPVTPLFTLVKRGFVFGDCVSLLRNASETLFSENWKRKRCRTFSVRRIVVPSNQTTALIQFSVSSAGTLSNSLRLFVTSTSPSLRACAAM